MLNVAFFLVALCAVQSYATVLRAPLLGRQTPAPPTTGACGVVCLAFANYLSNSCSTVSAGSVACLCTQTYFNDAQACYQCLVSTNPADYPLAQYQQGLKATQELCQSENQTVPTIVLTSGVPAPTGGTKSASGSSSSPTASKSSATTLAATGFGITAMISSVSAIAGVAWLFV